MTPPVFELHQGTQPLLLSIPHLGTHLPAEITPALAEEAFVLRDTDWHLDRLYGFAIEQGYSVLRARVSRYAIDLNRPPGGESLYPGQATTGLCPTETFKGVPLHKPGQAPDDDEIARRRQRYWQPYHDALRGELDRLQAEHGQVLLWEAHSIASLLPRLFDGRLPGLNFGTNSGASCADAVLQAALRPLASLPGAAVPTHVVNGRFKGGYITRHYGEPARGVHAIQLEMAQSLYMDEEAPFSYRPERAARIQPLLQAMLAGAVQQLRQPAAAA
ncbi:formylglutamte aminohyrolase [Azoarcus olearius]|uniref:N-formylglutamate deformylase n=1 Tax=Azoarcus sp. (strain BH72) TaxID=418699 RepID=UPI0008063902|nr:N-formylglutamate deformylase [Azoarcus olearius]ANQ86166.1 formylglutamte aminohyrolase [Azoarcus olearius]